MADFSNTLLSSFGFKKDGDSKKVTRHLSMANPISFKFF